MKGLGNFSINKKNNKLPIIFSWFFVCLFMIVAINLFSGPIKNVFYKISFPLQNVFWVAGESSSGFLGSVFSINSIAKENKDLKDQNQQLLSELAFFHTLQSGDQAQSEASATCQKSGYKFVMAGVVGLDDNDILSIDKGSQDGIIEGMPVVSQQNALFGKIYKVYKSYSKVMLITNVNSVTNVKVLQNDISDPEIDGVVKGKGGLSAFLDLVPISNEINLQDVLVTSSIDKSFPKDLLVGKITEKQKNDQKPFQQAQLQLFIDVKTVENLFVITNYKR